MGRSVPVTRAEPRRRTVAIAGVGAAVALIAGGIAAMMIAPRASGGSGRACGFVHADGPHVRRGAFRPAFPARTDRNACTHGILVGDRPVVLSARLGGLRQGASEHALRQESAFTRSPDFHDSAPAARRYLGLSRSRRGTPSIEADAVGWGLGPLAAPSWNERGREALASFSFDGPDYPLSIPLESCCSRGRSPTCTDQ